MPSVIVRLLYTAKPEEGMASVPVRDDPDGFVVHEAEGQMYIAADVALSRATPAEALSLARALALVAGCADERWPGWHWEARERKGRLLATTPLGEWYVNRDDCLKDIRTMFGYGVRVVLSDDIGHAGLLRSAYDRDIIDTGPHPTADDTPEADPEAAWWCKRCDSENASEACWFCKEPKPADHTPEQ